MKKTNPATKSHFESKTNPEMNLAAASKLRLASRQEVGDVYALLQSSADGISEAAAQERLATVGLNEVAYDRAPAWYTQLIKSFINPFILILAVLAKVSSVPVRIRVSILESKK